MPFDSALSAGNLVSLRGSSSVAPRHEATVLVSLCANTNVYTARINQSTFNFPLPELTYDGGSGTLANAKVGMTILISHTNDRAAAFWRGRVRKAPTATTLYINEAGDFGFTDNDYIFILNDHAIFDVLPRDVAGDPVPDYDTAFRQLKPLIRGLRSVYADYVDSGTGKYTLSFAPTVTAMADGATMSTYAWVIPSGGAITAGSTSTKDITVDFDAGFANWVSLTATDDNGTPNTFWFHVWAHDRSSNPPTLLTVGRCDIDAEVPSSVTEGAGLGHNATISAFDGVDSVLDNTLICIWTDQKYNGTAGDPGSQGNILMSGRLRTEASVTVYEDDTGQRDASVEFTIEGPLSQLDNLGFPSIQILDAASPSSWFEIADLTVQRAVWLILSECSTFASLHGVKFFSTAETYRDPGLVTQGGDLLNSVADPLMSLNAVLCDNAAGMCEVIRRGCMMNASDRAGQTTIAAWAATDYHKIEYRRDHMLYAVGRLRGDGGGYNTSTAYISGYEAEAPAGAWGPGAGETQLPRQILASDQSEADEKSELAQRAGDALAAAQVNETISVEHPAGYWFLVPDPAQRYTWTLAAAETARERALSAVNFWLTRKALSVDFESGVITVNCDYLRESDGANGAAIVWPKIDSGLNPISLGSLSDFYNLPATDDESTTLDFTVDDYDPEIGNGTYTPGTGWESVCTGGVHYMDLIFDIGSSKTLKTISVTYVATATQATIMNSIGLRDDAEFFGTVDQFFTLTGTNTRTTGVIYRRGRYIRVILYGDDDACTDTIVLDSLTYTTVKDSGWRETFDFTASSGGWALDTALVNSGSPGSYAAGTGFQDGDFTTASDNPSRGIYVTKDALRAGAFTRIEVVYDYTEGNTDSASATAFILVLEGSALINKDFSEVSSASDISRIWAGSASADDLQVRIVSDFDDLGVGGSVSFAGSVTLKRIICEGTGNNPFRPL